MRIPAVPLVNDNSDILKEIVRYPSDHEFISPPPINNEEFERILLEEKWKNIKEVLGENITTLSASDKEYDVPFIFHSPSPLSIDDEHVSVNAWIDDENILFTKDFPEDGFFDDFEQYHYNLKTGLSKNIGRGSKNAREWMMVSAFSPDDTFWIHITERNSLINTVPDDLGTVSIKNLKTGKTKVLGKDTFYTGADGSYISTSYSDPTWSPNGKYIAFFDDKNWNDKGRGVSVIRSDAQNLSEMIFLGRTIFREIGRPSLEQYIFWSPDSTKFFVRDGHVVFSIDPIIKEIYRPTSEKPWNEGWWLWSPDGEKMLVNSYDVFGFYILDPQTTTKRGFLLKVDSGITSRSDFDISVNWAPDSLHVVYTYDNLIHILNIDSGEHKAITAERGNYENPIWSPDGKKIIYQKDNKVWMMSVASK